MTKINFYDKVDEKLFKFAVISVVGVTAKKNTNS